MNTSTRLLTFRGVASCSLFVLLILFGSAYRVGWFADRNFYVIVQNNPSGKYIDGWVVQGAPKNDNGVYIFTAYSNREIRIPIQGTVVTKTGKNSGDAARVLNSARNPDHLMFTGSRDAPKP